MRIISIFILSLFFMQIYACNKSKAEPVKNSNETLKLDTLKLKVTIGNKVFTATLLENATAKAFKSKLPMTINMIELNGNEKYVDMAESLPTNASNPGTIQNGDLMLYGSKTLVLFYKSFSTSYNYTKLGRIENTSGLSDALRAGNVTVTIELDKGQFKIT
jgi:hypothetical protein